MSGKTYGGGEVIFRKGDHADSLFLILEGSVDIVLDGGTRLTELTKGQYFGEMGALTARPRSATAIVHEDGTILWEIPWDKMDECFETNPELILELMKHLSRRLRSLTKEYEDACAPAPVIGPIAGFVVGGIGGFFVGFIPAAIEGATIADD